MRKTSIGIAAMVLVVGVFLVQQPVSGQKTKGKTRPATTKLLMKGIMGPNCGALAKLLKRSLSK